MAVGRLEAQPRDTPDVGMGLSGLVNTMMATVALAAGPTAPSVVLP